MAISRSSTLEPAQSLLALNIHARSLRSLGRALREMLYALLLVARLAFFLIRWNSKFEILSRRYAGYFQKFPNGEEGKLGSLPNFKIRGFIHWRTNMFPNVFFFQRKIWT
jgi:hypothetical protein